MPDIADRSVLGTPFYVMEFAKGRIFVDPTLPGLTPQQRRDVYWRTADTLAALHALNPERVGLADYGRPQRYCARQAERWAAQYTASVPQPHPDVLRLISWLRANVPAEDASPPGGGAVCHGDYRLDNLVWDEQLQVGRGGAVGLRQGLHGSWH